MKTEEVMVAVAFGATNPHWDRVKRKTKAVMVRRLEQTEADWDPDYDSGQEPPAYDRHCGRVLSWTQRIDERGRPEPKQILRGGPPNAEWVGMGTGCANTAWEECSIYCWLLYKES